MLEDRINKDYIEAMKARDQVRSSALSYLRAMIKQVKVDSRLEALDDAGVRQAEVHKVRRMRESMPRSSNHS